MRKPRHVPHVPVEVECQAWADFIYTTANTTSLASHPLHLHLPTHPHHSDSRGERVIDYHPFTGREPREVQGAAGCCALKSSLRSRRSRVTEGF